MNDVENFGDRLRGLSVLVVEDNGLLCCVLEETLREAGCEVVGPYARLGEAMKAAADSRIDLALLDINVRGELVSPLAERLRERGVPFVLTSAYESQELPYSLQSAIQLRKPYTDLDLLDRLASLVGEPRRSN
ncbi:MAG TPA: response regulator [Steroidobacteraceae bacterium]